MVKVDEGVQKPRGIQSGDVVGYRFVIRNQAGEVLATSTELLHYVHGGGSVLPDEIEDQMEGRRSGETFTAPLSEDGEDASRTLRRVTLPNERFPHLFELPPGTRIDAAGPGGNELSLEIAARKAVSMTLDFDHPFGDDAVRFDVSVVSIRTATSAEWKSGRPDAATVVNERLKADLSRLREVLTRQFADEDSDDGLFDVLIHSGTTSERRVGVLRDEHEALLTELDAIIERVSEDGGDFDHRPALARLTRGVAQHDEDGAELLIDSMNRDVGGEG